MERNLLYIMEPYCAGCYANLHNMRTLMQDYPDDLIVEIVPYGLYVEGNVRHLTPSFATYLDTKVREIAVKTGAPIADKYYQMLKQNSVIFDSEIPSRAILTAQQLWPQQNLMFMGFVQEALYQEGLDLTQEETYRGIAARVGIPEKGFLELFRSEEMKRKTAENFTWAKSLTKAPPTLIFYRDKMPYVVESEYLSLESIRKHLKPLLRAEQGVTAD